jgi:hypothetical protein
VRLTELNPRWYVLPAGGPKIGLTFDCPHCRTERLGVAFHHTGREAMEDAELHTHGQNGPIWLISGDSDGYSFEHLSLSPSIDASAVGHWHGFITDGEVK